jgi:exonuclease III
MATSLRISAWNANGLKHHVQEIVFFLNIKKIDISLVSESHTTENTLINISHYTINYANHPDGTVHAGSAIIIRSTLKHYELKPFITKQYKPLLYGLKPYLDQWQLLQDIVLAGTQILLKSTITS